MWWVGNCYKQGDYGFFSPSCARAAALVLYQASATFRVIAAAVLIIRTVLFLRKGTQN
jgi:hypothetical protein